MYSGAYLGLSYHDSILLKISIVEMVSLLQAFGISYRSTTMITDLSVNYSMVFGASISLAMSSPCSFENAGPVLVHSNLLKSFVFGHWIVSVFSLVNINATPEYRKIQTNQVRLCIRT